MTQQQTSVRPVQHTPAPSAPSRTTGRSAAVRRLGLLGAVLVAVLAPATIALGAPQPAPMVFGLALIAWAPGHCAAVAAQIWDPLLFAVVSVAVSLCVCVVVASSLLYLGVFEPLTVILDTAAVTLAIAAVGWLKARAR